MNLAIRILHYTKEGRPDRTKWVEVIKYMLNDPRVKVFVDNSGIPYGGLKNAYLDIAKDNPDQVLMLHHDILPCFNFIPTVEKLIELTNKEPMSFYTNNKTVETALKGGTHWIKQKIWYYTQAYTMPFAVFEDAIKWIDENVMVDDRNSDDERMAMYFYYHNKPMLTTVPSLVEHIGWNTTTVDYDRPLDNYLDNREHRMAKKFIGIDMDPTTIDWTRGLDNPILSTEDWALEDSDVLFQKLLKPTSKYKK